MSPPEPPDHVKDVVAFKNRVFSGHDLLQVLEMEGIGVGAAMHLIRRIEMNARRQHGRELTFDDGLTVSAVEQALTRKPTPSARRLLG